MQMIRKPERWLCMAAAWSMALDISLSRFLREVGHDGGEIIFPGNPPPTDRRGHLSQECIRAAWRLGKTATQFDALVVIAERGGRRHDVELPIDHLLKTERGVVIGMTPTWHAVAFERGLFYDPDLTEPSLNLLLTPKRLWVIK